LRPIRRRIRRALDCKLWRCGGNPRKCMSFGLTANEHYAKSEFTSTYKKLSFRGADDGEISDVFAACGKGRTADPGQFNFNGCFGFALRFPEREPVSGYSHRSDRISRQRTDKVRGRFPINNRITWFDPGNPFPAAVSRGMSPTLDAPDFWPGKLSRRTYCRNSPAV
jgi:hypothetical protein